MRAVYERLPRVPHLWLKVVLLACSMTTVMAGATIAPALPGIQRHFAAHPQAAALVPLTLTMPALFIAGAAPLLGVVLDRLGRLPVMTLCAVLYLVAGTTGLWVESLEALLAGRALLGVAVAGLMTGATALIADYFAGAEREHFLAVRGGFMAFGGVVFILGGGLLADLHWRGPFAVYAAVLVVLAGILFILHEPTREPAPSAGDGDGTAQRGKGPAPSPWGVIGAGYLAVFAGMLLFYLVPVKLPFLLERSMGATATQTGLVLASLTLVAGLMAFQYRRVRRYFSPPAICALMFVLVAAGYGVLLSAGGSLAVAVLAMVVVGMGFGLLMPNVSVWMSIHAPVHLRGRVFGGLTSAVFLGQFLSPLAAELVSSGNAPASLLRVFAAAGVGGLLLALGYGAALVPLRRRSAATGAATEGGGDA